MEKHEFKITIECLKCGCEMIFAPWGDIIEKECEECGAIMEVSITTKVFLVES
jgi:hypothetical protein